MPEQEYVSIPKLVVTGGPCGGKSSGLSYLARNLSDYGFQVYVAKEGATFLIEQGMQVKKAVAMRDWESVARYQSEILEFQLHNEDQLERFARIDGRAKPITLCDRGCADGRAYLEEGPMGDKQFARLLNTFGYDLFSILDRYAGVIHLVTAADGKPDFYTCASNAARDETPEQAIYLDGRTQHAWLMHRKPRVIDNSTDFPGKLRRALQAACQILGIPKPLHIQRKYALKPFTGSISIPVTHERIAVEQAYLRSEYMDEQLRIRKRSKNGSAVYYFARRYLRDNGILEGAETCISKSQYELQMAQRDPMRGIIRKDRIVFMWRHQYCKLDFFSHPALPPAILEIEPTELQDTVLLPPFLDISQEVTGNPEYSNYVLSLKMNHEGVRTQ